MRERLFRTEWTIRAAILRGFGFHGFQGRIAQFPSPRFDFGLTHPRHGPPIAEMDFGTRHPAPGTRRSTPSPPAPGLLHYGFSAGVTGARAWAGWPWPDGGVPRVKGPRPHDAGNKPLRTANSRSARNHGETTAQDQESQSRETSGQQPGSQAQTARRAHVSATAVPDTTSCLGLRQGGSRLPGRGG